MMLVNKIQSLCHPLEIRLALIQEAPQCREIIHKAYEAGRKLMSRDPKVLLRSEGDFIALSKQKRLYAILLQATLVGTFKLTLNDAPAILESVALLPAYQNRGLGSIALKWIVQLVKNNGFDIIRLETYEKWHQTNKFYSHMGFQLIESFTKENEIILVWEKLISSDEPVGTKVRF